MRSGWFVLAGAEGVEGGWVVAGSGQGPNHEGPPVTGEGTGANIPSPPTGPYSHHRNLRTSPYAAKRDSADLIKLRNLGWGGCPGLSQGS